MVLIVMSHLEVLSGTKTLSNYVLLALCHTRELKNKIKYNKNQLLLNFKFFLRNVLQEGFFREWKLIFLKELFVFVYYLLFEISLYRMKIVLKSSYSKIKHVLI